MTTKNSTPILRKLKHKTMDEKELRYNIIMAILSNPSAELGLRIDCEWDVLRLASDAIADINGGVVEKSQTGNPT